MKTRLSFVPPAFAALVALGLAACKPAAPEKTSAASGPAGAPAAAAAPAAPTALPKLGVAPTWSLKDLNGNVVSSEQLKGKVVVVDFWATWCGPCRVEIPGYVEMQKKYGAEGLTIVGVSLDQAGPAVVKAFVDKNGVSYPIVMGDEAVVGAFGGIEAIPTTFLIDREGQIRDRKIGAEETADYEKKVLAVLRQG